MKRKIILTLMFLLVLSFVSASFNFTEHYADYSKDPTDYYWFEWLVSNNTDVSAQSWNRTTMWDGLQKTGAGWNDWNAGWTAGTQGYTTNTNCNPTAGYDGEWCFRLLTIHDDGMVSKTDIAPGFGILNDTNFTIEHDYFSTYNSGYKGANFEILMSATMKFEIASWAASELRCYGTTLDIPQLDDNEWYFVKFTNWGHNSSCTIEIDDGSTVLTYGIDGSALASNITSINQVCGSHVVNDDCYYGTTLIYEGHTYPTAPSDITPPVISNLYDVTGAGTNKTTDTTPTINLTTDENAICNISIDNSTWFSFTTTGALGHQGTVDATDPLEIEDYQNVTVNCSDSSLNSAYATIVYNITDGVPPAIDLNEPIDNAEFELGYNNTIVLNFTVTDNYFSTLDCNLTINNVLNQSNTSVLNGTKTSWNSTTFGIGSYDWNVSCVDGHGNSNSSQRSFIVNDTIAPTITIQSPVNNTVYYNTSVDLEWTYVDESDLDSAVYSLDGGGNNTFYDLCYQESANITNQTGIDGNCGLDYTGNTYLSDNWWAGGGAVIDGNKGTNDFPIGNTTAYLYVNYTKPINSLNTSLWNVIDQAGIVNNLSIASCWEYHPNIIELRVRSQDGEDPSSNITFSCYNGLWQVLRLVKDSLTNVWEEAMWWDLSSNITLTSLSEGSHNITIYGEDTYGNIGQSPYTFFNVSLSPTVNLSKPDDNAVFKEGINNTFVLNFTATDVAHSTLDCNLTINGVLNQTNASVNNGTLTNWNSTKYEINNYIWNVSCINPYGYSDSAQRNFSVVEQVCTANEITIYLDGLNQSGKYEYQSVTNISANATGTLENGTSCSPEVCINLNAPNYGVNYSCNDNNTSFLYNITILRQSNFTTNNSNETLSATGQLYVSMDNRTELTSVSFNVSSEGTTYDLTINNDEIRGILTDIYLKDTEFVVTSYTNSTNLTYPVKGSRNIYVNLSAHPINLTFQISGFQADEGNALNFFEYFNDTNDTTNNLHSYSGVEPMGEYDNMELNTSKNTWYLETLNSGGSYTITWTDATDAYWNLQSGSFSADGYGSGWITNLNDTNFDLKNYTRIDIERYDSHSGSCIYSSAHSCSAESSLYITDKTDQVRVYYKVDNAAGGTFSATYNYNLSLRKVTQNSWDVYIDDAFDANYDLNSLNQTAKWYIKMYGKANKATQAFEGSASQLSKIYRMQASGLWMNKSRTGTEFTNGTATSKVIGQATGSDYTGVYVYSDYLILNNTNISYEFSADNGTTWRDAWDYLNTGLKMLFLTQGRNLTYRINLTGTNESSPILYNLNIQVIPASTENVTIDFGFNEDIFTYTGKLNTTTSPRNITINTSTLHIYNSTYTTISISSGTAGQIQVDNLVINSSINPVILNETDFEDCSTCELNFSFAGSAIRVYGLAFDFLGSWNYTATAHSGSISAEHKIQVYYSKFNVTFPSGIYWYDVFPSSKDDKNVTPQGQDKDNPIWNITSFAYDLPFDVYVRTNETFSCFNITYSNRSFFVTNYTVINESFTWLNGTVVLLNHSKIYSGSVIVFNQTSFIYHTINNESFTWLNGTAVFLTYGNITSAVVFNQTNVQDHTVINESFTWLNGTEIYLANTNIVSGTVIVFNQTTARNNYISNESFTWLNGTAVELNNDDIVSGSVIVFNQTTVRDNYIDNESFVWINNTAVTLNNQNLVSGTVIVFNQTTTRNNYIVNENFTWLNGTAVRLNNTNIVVDSVVVFNQTSNVTVVNESDLNALLWKNNTRMNLDNVNANVTSLYRCNDSLIIPISNYTVLYSAGEIVCLDNSSDYYDNMTVCVNYTYFVSETISSSNYIINYTEGNITLITNYRNGSQLGVNYTYTTQNLSIIGSGNYTINYTLGTINLTTNYKNNTQFGINYTYNTFVSEVIGSGNYTINYSAGNITLTTNYLNNTQFGINYTYTTQNISTVGSGNYTINYTIGTINLTTNYFNNTQFGINYSYIVYIDSVVGSGNYTLNYSTGNITLISNYFNNTQFGINYTYWTRNSSEVIGSGNYTINYADGTINLTTGYKDETQFGINYSYYTETYGYDSTLDYNLKLNTSYQQILQNVSDWKGIYNWVDLTNCTGVFYMPYVYFSTVCSDCYFDINQLDYYNILVE